MGLWERPTLSSAPAIMLHTTTSWIRRPPSSMPTDQRRWATRQSCTVCAARLPKPLPRATARQRQRLSLALPRRKRTTSMPSRPQKPMRQLLSTRREIKARRPIVSANGVRAAKVQHRLPQTGPHLQNKLLGGGGEKKKKKKKKKS